MIQAGDIIMVKNRNWIGAAIRLLTRSHWNHCGCFVSSKSLVEATHSGVVESNIKKFEDGVKNKTLEYAVFRVTGLSKEKGRDIANFVLTKVGDKYDNLLFIKLTFMYLLHIPRRVLAVDEQKRYICSELVSEAYDSVGIRFSYKIKAGNIVPADIARSTIVEQVS